MHITLVLYALSDVERCMGLPRGPLNFMKKPAKENSELVEEWRSHIGRSDRGSHTRPNELLNSVFFAYNENDHAPSNEEISNRVERYKDSRWFIRDLIVLLFLSSSNLFRVVL